MLRVAVLCAFFVLARGQTTEVTRCVFNSAELPINVYVRGCVTPPCNLPQLTDVIIDIIFRSPRTITSMTTLASALVSPIPIPVPYPLGVNAVTCNFLANTYCPLVPDEVVQYTVRMHIESFFPVNTLANVEFRVEDNVGIIFCVRVPLRVAPPLSTASANVTNV